MSMTRFFRKYLQQGQPLPWGRWVAIAVLIAGGAYGVHEARAQIEPLRCTNGEIIIEVPNYICPIGFWPYYG